MMGHAIGLFFAGVLIAEGVFFCLFSEEINQRRARQSAERGLVYPRPGHIHPRILGWVVFGTGAIALAANLPFFLWFHGA
jgi:hypothetical protein